MLLTKSRANALDHLQDVIGLWHDDVLQKVNESLAKRSLEVSQAFSKTKAELLVR